MAGGYDVEKAGDGGLGREVTRVVWGEGVGGEGDEQPTQD